MLLKSEAFNCMKPEQLKELLGYFHEDIWPKNTCILNNQKFLYHFFIILSGRIKMYNVDETGEKEHTLFLLRRGDVFDLYCLLDGKRHEVYYECLDDTRILEIPMDRFRIWLKENPVCYQNFLAYAGKMMRRLENNVSELIFTDISTRLLRLLLNNINEHSNKLELINDLPNKELANLIGSTRAVVNRHLQKLKKNGSIKLSRNQVEIRDIRLLLKELENHSK